MKSWLANLALLAVGMLAGLLALEAGLRLAGFPGHTILGDHTVGYRFVPHARFRHVGEGGVQAGRFNAEGWRDVEHALAKPPGTTRLVLLGDSFVAALQVPLDSTFYRRLEGALNARAGHGRRFEVIALGQDGNGTTAEYLTYRRWGARYDPDVVAVLFILNDQADNWRPAALDPRRPFFVEDGDSLRLDTSFADSPEFRRWERMPWFKSHSVLWATAREAWLRLHPQRRPAAQPGGPAEDGYYRRWNFDRRLPADSIPAFRLTERILARFAAEVARDGRRFVVFAAGFAQQEDRDLLAAGLRDSTFDPDKTQRWLREVGVRHGFEVVPLTPAFRAASAAVRRPLWFGDPVSGYGHWNSAGHAVAAAAMADYFERTLGGPDSSAARR